VADERVLVERIPLQFEGANLGLITMNRPQQMNPLDWSTIKILDQAFRELAEDASVRVMAVTGAGKAFSAGGDLKAYLDLQADEAGFREFLEDIHRMFDFIEAIPKPVIALVNGVTAAGGLELLLSCDFAYAVESARVGDGHLNFGQMGGGGVLARLPRQIPPQKARELLYSGRLLTAQEVLELGIVNKVVADGELLAVALEYANLVAQKSPLGVANMKFVVNNGLKMRLEDALLLERRITHHYCLTSFDAREGLTAFSEKRKPKYEGR